jgi:hypothetical protein
LIAPAVQEQFRTLAFGQEQQPRQKDFGPQHR